MDIRTVIKKNSKIDYIQQCIRKIGNEEFVKDVLDISTHPSIIKFEEYGELNKDKNIYIISEGHPSGLFGLWNVTIEKLKFADRYHLCPVVEWTNKTLFYEKEGVDNIYNVFEYYFEQVSDISLEEAKQSYNVAYMRYADSVMKKKYISYYWTVNDIDEYAYLQEKYIKLNRKTRDYVEKGISELLKDKKMIGVHVRATDFNIQLKNHPKIVIIEDYLKKTQKIMNKTGIRNIFLATDDYEVINTFSDIFKNNLYYYKDVFRTTGERGPHCTENGRLNHKYRLGLEVIRDAYTLANCSALIAGKSNVSFAARVINKTISPPYIECSIIDNGMNNTDSLKGKIYRKRMNKIDKV